LPPHLNPFEGIHPCSSRDGGSDFCTRRLPMLKFPSAQGSWVVSPFSCPRVLPREPPPPRGQLSFFFFTFFLLFLADSLDNDTLIRSFHAVLPPLAIVPSLGFPLPFLDRWNFFWSSGSCSSHAHPSFFPPMFFHTFSGPSLFNKGPCFFDFEPTLWIFPSFAMMKPYRFPFLSGPPFPP